MAGRSRKKKILIPAAAVLLTGALGAGIWFGTQGSGEPVSVYPFMYIGMTEFWGDNQESYGPVTTDKIQTEFLSDTQTVTEVAVKEGDTVKKGDVLFSFDTTLDALSLERKRLEVEKIKVQIKAAEERLREIQSMDPYIPSGGTEVETEEPDLGEELKDKLYQISENTVYDGKTAETALVCWLKDDTALSDAILQDLYETALKYQQENADKEEQEETETPEDQKETSSASAVPTSLLQNLVSGMTQMQPEEKAPLKIQRSFTGKKTDREEDTVNIGRNSFKIVDAISYKGTETYWLKEARRISDQALLEGEALVIPGYPQSDPAQQQQWQDLWGKGVALEYTRSVTFESKVRQDDRMVPFDGEETLQLKTGEDAVMVISSQIQDLPKETELTYSISPADGIFQTTTVDNYLFLMGNARQTTAAPVEYTVTARYTFDDNDDTNRAVEETFSFRVSVGAQQQKGSFYVVFKVTQDNFQEAAPVIWQGMKVTVYEDGTFDKLLYDASGFADHTLPPPEDVEIDLPVILPGIMYTEEELQEMQNQLYVTVREQLEKQKLAESEYKIMERELGDGNVYAEIDGKVVALLSEEEARQNQQPVVKVSGGGGFYIEGSVSELQKESLKIGQEVTINDWSSGGMYTGEVISIGDFPTDDDNWNGMGNPTVSYYPFKAFVSEEADLKAGSYVSMTYSASSASQGIYLEKAFVRSDKDGSYIYIRGADGRLEKRSVRVGKVLWGSYYEILSDLSEEDYLAFPYGKNVKHGAPTVESDLSVLYGY